MKNKRCAIYTRKSSEEGLELAFNSLDAQREAAVDYIRSQKHEGWELIKTKYDDGAYSGGTMQRPALQKLLEDIKEQLAREENCSTRKIRKYMVLINLGPEILKKALTGILPSNISLLHLLRASDHLDWNVQRKYLNI